MKGEVEAETRDGEQQQKWTSELMKCFCFLNSACLEHMSEGKGPGRIREAEGLGRNIKKRRVTGRVAGCFR